VTRFYGWKIVGVAFLNHFVAVGFLFYSYGVFFKALAADFGGSRLGVGLGLALMNCATGVFAPFLGRALDRISIRHLMCLGALLLSAGFFAASQIRYLWQFYVLLTTLLGMGAAMIGALPSTTLVANWFVRRRGTAFGIATVGISMSGLVMAPISTRLIAALGWRGTFVVYGALVLVLVVPAVWLVVVNRPEEMGLRPDGGEPPGRSPDRAPERAARSAPGDKLIRQPAQPAGPTRGLLRQSAFWAITLAISFNFCGSSSILTHIIPHVTDLGFTGTEAAFVLSTMAGFGVLGKLLFGWLSDRMDKRAALWLATGIQAVGVLLVWKAATYPALLAAGSVFGLGMGGMVPLWGALVGAAFGRHAFGRAMGLMAPFMLPIQIAGVPFTGYVFDRTGSYVIAFGVLMGVYLAAAAALLLLRLPEAEPGGASASAS
jgi:MFS family permease